MPTVSRRSFLALAGLAPAALLSACDVTPPPASSPFLVGPYATAQVILGESANTTAMDQVFSTRQWPKDYLYCQDGKHTTLPLPSKIKAAVYYPQRLKDPYVTGANPLSVMKGPHPVLLFAHGVRIQDCTTPYPIDRDFTRAEVILRHVAAYGCVAVAPDLSWLPGDFPGAVTIEQAIESRASVLTAYYAYLHTLNTTLFAGQLDLSRIILVGHSTGAGACTKAGADIAATANLHSLAYGMLGPYVRRASPVPYVDTNTHNLVVLKGTLDLASGTDARGCYSAAGTRKTLVTIPGANHFGYTHLCELDNTCGGIDTAGTISRTGQQQTAAAYLAALLRFYALGDATARPYLSGERAVEGLEFWGVTGVQVEQSGVKQAPVVHP